MLKRVEDGTIATLEWPNVVIYWKWYCLELNLRPFKSLEYLFSSILKLPGVSRAERTGKNLLVDIDVLRAYAKQEGACDDSSLFSFTSENTSILEHQ